MSYEAPKYSYMGKSYRSFISNYFLNESKVVPFVYTFGEDKILNVYISNIFVFIMFTSCIDGHFLMNVNNVV